ncbi:MAG TPA: uracil-DNA glycosylase [Candidatus Lustribacter sp.]|jgi:uracil-DNA glycosylase family 4|nr:uracil-DNA glycosylase [Candidatus Lustribacter sp.]
MTTQAGAVDAIQRKVIACRRCPELVAYRETVAREKRRAYREHEYWGKPVPAFGDPLARVVLVGLAPGAHGSNRTGRMFTGDASGEWLYRALHRAGFASQAHQADRNDGMRLRNALITAAVRCAPPGNKPTPDERTACLPYLEAELAAMKGVRVIVTLGKIADDTVHRIVKSAGEYRSPRAPFKHGAETRIALPASPDATILASYHPSRQNTSTKVLTEPMLDAIFARARELSA